MRPTRAAAACLLLLCLLAAGPAHAGMGNRASAPNYRPAPCQGETCRADDVRSGLPCEGLLCTFSSAKAMTPPVTAAQAAQAQQAEAAAVAVKPVEVSPKAGRPSKRAKARAGALVSGADASAK